MATFDFLFVPTEPSENPLSSFKVNCLVFFLFFALSLSLMAPIANDHYMSDVKDIQNHTALIVQAKAAIDQGQFPIRTSTYENHGLNYPIFQFYSPFFYHIAGTIYKWFTPSNPYVALKAMMQIALLLAGIFTYRSVFLLTQNVRIAWLSGLVYMCSPYLLVNMHARGAITELFAQGLIPVVLYYNLRCYQQNTPLYAYPLLALSWAALSLSHTITFFYTSFFMGILFLMLTLYRIQPITSLIKLGLAYALSLLLTLWFIVPMHQVGDLLAISTLINDPSFYSWLTPLSTLLSFTAVSPMPLPGNGLLQDKIYLSLGLPLLLALGLSFVRFAALEPTTLSRRFFTVVLGVFFLAFLMAWSPFDVYAFLPKVFNIGQFSYRLLSQCMWVGSLIFALFLSELFTMEKIKDPFIVAFAAIIILSASSWITTLNSSKNTIESVITQPGTTHSADAYLPLVEKLPIPAQAEPEPSKLFFMDHCTRDKTLITCKVNASSAEKLIPLPSLYYPGLNHISMDGQPTPYSSVLSSAGLLVAAIKVPAGDHTITIEFVGSSWANRISAAAFILVLLFLTGCVIRDLRKRIK